MRNSSLRATAAPLSDPMKISNVNTISLLYQPSLVRYASKVAHRAYTIWLDSCRPQSTQGRYEILVYDPEWVIKAQQNSIRVTNRSGITQHYDDNPFDILKHLLAEYPLEESQTLPFCGGFVGYFAYDLGRCCETLPSLHSPLENFYDIMGGIYRFALVSDHQQQTTQIIGNLTQSALAEEIDQLEQMPTIHLPPFKLLTSPTPEAAYSEYADSFSAISDYIQAGDCYQVNLSQRFHAAFSGAPWSAYLHLRQQNPTPFAAYMHCENYQIISCSPERFLQVSGDKVLTQPIKGTIKRAADLSIDNMLAEKLLASEKDHAENIMIVDLMRNDISRNCIPGSVTVPKLCQLQSFPQVHHLVSLVSGQLIAGKTALDCLRDCFPGGSITGAPKIRAMEIIEELETSRRGIYCGSIGYLSFNGNLDSSIAIRTLLCQNQKLTVSAGGAIVADSDCKAEYQECFTKLQSIFDTLNQLK